ncbi:raffinose/stachyose/melibiose transport system permease protein [Microbacterium phyllosphaerae]|uniref:Raffinose/stachyose/melibiose transport system permease protein n=1 Tax=Microbacterium phyllosphaerae TaxID=124798 RepID=A0ABS4WUT2_9MICO|nr:sugar ABC transporter permease [Microbacterium phyllosphaerae]MBP2379906.1 raffinose/stachyose/melibiose transport system permease protein [Microbacterium phyllosphaerae]
MSTLTSAVRATTPGPEGSKRARRVRTTNSRALPAYYWMVWPAVIAFAAFHTIPVIVGIFFSFTNYAGYGDWNFVGISNYLNLFKDDRVLKAYGFSFLFAIVATILTNVISLSIAMGLNAKIRARNFWRGVYFVPYVLAILVIGYVFQFLFSNSLPKILSGIPLFRDNILTNPDWAWTAIVALAVWQACAFSIIIYLSGLQTIPSELYEAASLDGASSWRQFGSITFPLISAFFTINVVLSLKGFLQVFDPIVALTNGGPGTSTESVTLLVFRGGFSGGEFAYQTANAVIFFIVITIVSLLQFRVLQRREADI